MAGAIPQATITYLEGLRSHVGGLPALYATKFVRSDERADAEANARARTAFDAALNTSHDIASAVPADGWIIAPPRGIHLFRKSFTGGVGTDVGVLTGEVITSVTAEHGRKGSRSYIEIAMIDGSSARLQVRTGDSFPSFAPWVRWSSMRLVGSPADSVESRPVL